MIELSRKDILSDSLMQFSEDRFVKLPIEGYLELLGIEPNSAQTGIINALNNPKYRFVCAAVSRRQGKTYIANILGQLVSLVPNSHILLMSPNYALSQISFDLQRQLIKHFDLEVIRDNAKDKVIELSNNSTIRMGSINQVDSVVGRSYDLIIFDLQRQLIKHFDLEVIRDNAKDKVIELSNNSTIRMGSINQVDSVVGRSYDLIIFDEAALVDGKDAFNVALRPTLDKQNAKALFISTPRGRNNWFAEFYYRGFSNEFPEWASLKATYHENPRLSEADIAEAKKTMSEAEFNQEYMADFNVFEGQIWTFDHEKCIEDLSEYETKRMDIFAGMDVGYKDPTAFVVIGYDWDTNKYYILDEYLDSERTTEQHAVEIRKMIDKWDIDYIYIDSAAQQTRYDFAQNYDISTINAKKSVLDGIGHVAGVVDNDNLIVHSNCKETIWALDQYQWDPNPNLLKEKPKHNAASHMADALRYGLYSFETSMTTF